MCLTKMWLKNKKISYKMYKVLLIFTNANADKFFRQFKITKIIK